MRATNKIDKAANKNQLDPLYVIFEQHLFNFQDSDADRKGFISNIVREYISFLRKKNVVIPMPLEHVVCEELAVQVNTMLVKKIYGCLSISEYQRSQPTTKRKTARARYSKLSKA